MRAFPAPLLWRIPVRLFRKVARMDSLQCNSLWLSRLLFGLLAMLVVGSPAAQTTYPEKPVRIIVGFPPGGPPDVLARLLGQKFVEARGKPVVIDNAPGRRASRHRDRDFTLSVTDLGDVAWIVNGRLAASAGQGIFSWRSVSTVGR